MGALYLRGSVWWAKYYKAGRPIRESTGCHEGERKKAEAFLKAREGDVASGRPVSPGASRIRLDELLADLITDYRNNARPSLANVERIARRLLSAFGNRRAHDLSGADIRAFIAARRADGAENATVNRELAALKRAFNLGLKDEKILRKPHFAMLREDNVRTGFFGAVEFLALHEALPEYLRPVVTFACVYGWRKREILGLTWDRVDLAAGTVRLDPGGTKNREGRTVILTADLRRILTAQWEKACAILRARNPEATGREVAEAIPWVFHRDGKQLRDFTGAWAVACKKAGLVGRVPHDFRRTAVRNMVRAGIPERVAMTITGHKTRSVFDRYNIVSEGDLREAAVKLSAGIPVELVPGTISGTMAPSESLPEFSPLRNPLK